MIRGSVVREDFFEDEGSVELDIWRGVLSVCVCKGCYYLFLFICFYFVFMYVGCELGFVVVVVYCVGWLADIVMVCGVGVVVGMGVVL